MIFIKMSKKTSAVLIWVLAALTIITSLASCEKPEDVIDFVAPDEPTLVEPVQTTTPTCSYTAVSESATTTVGITWIYSDWTPELVDTNVATFTQTREVIERVEHTLTTTTTFTPSSASCESKPSSTTVEVWEQDYIHEESQVISNTNYVPPTFLDKHAGIYVHVGTSWQYSKVIINEDGVFIQHLLWGQSNNYQNCHTRQINILELYHNADDFTLVENNENRIKWVNNNDSEIHFTIEHRVIAGRDIFDYEHVFRQGTDCKDDFTGDSIDCPIVDNGYQFSDYAGDVIDPTDTSVCDRDGFIPYKRHGFSGGGRYSAWINPDFPNYVLVISYNPGGSRTYTASVKVNDGTFESPESGQSIARTDHQDSDIYHTFAQSKDYDFTFSAAANYIKNL